MRNIVQSGPRSSRGHLRKAVPLILALMTILAPSISAQEFLDEPTVQLEWDKLLSDQTQPDKSMKKFMLVMEDQSYYNESNHLSITAFATSYNSDPDIFIQKRVDEEGFPSSAKEAKWYSEREGTDAVFISKDDVQQGDIFLITVYCQNECDYDLRTYYAPEIDISNADRSVYRWGGHSSNILKYYIPNFSSGGLTEQIDIRIEPEGDYKYLEVYISFDDRLSVIEDRPTRHMLDSGLAIMMNTQDFRWCTNCNLYIMVNMIEDRRVYISSSAKQIDTILFNQLSSYLLANDNKKSCLRYSIASKKNSQVYSVKTFQGAADLFLGMKYEPSYKTSGNVLELSETLYPQQNFIVSILDRLLDEQDISNYHMCAQAYDAFSAQIFVDDDEHLGRYDINQLEEYNFNLHRDQSIEFRFSKEELRNQDLKIDFELTIFTTERGDSTQLTIINKLCTYGECILSEEESKGQTTTVEVIPTSVNSQVYGDLNVKDKKTRITYSGQLDHRWAFCNETDQCTYIIGVYNPSVQTGPRNLMLKVEMEIPDIQDIRPDESYKNIAEKGRYIYYRILDSFFDLDYVSSLKIELISYLGDADLFITTDPANDTPTIYNYEFCSQRRDQFDEVMFTDEANLNLPSKIYIGVYAVERSEFEIKMTPTYKPIDNKRLTYATPIIDRKAIFDDFQTEFDYTLATFMPWWSGNEDRTVVFLANAVEQKVTFYIKDNDIPTVYNNAMFDENEIFVIRPDEEGYIEPDPSTGSAYYVRIRANYSISAFIDRQPYRYFFFAFTQPTGDVLIDLYPGDPMVGVAFKGQNTFYRHYLTDNQLTLNVTLTAFPNKGRSKLMVKLKSETVYPNSQQPESFDAKQEMANDQESIRIALHRDQRKHEDPDCDFAGYQKEGGNTYCTIFIAVECSDDVEICAYELTLDLYSYTAIPAETGKLLTESQYPPKYIPKDVDYVDGIINAGESQYFYLPYTNDMGDLMVMVNKTNPIGQGADLMFACDIQKHGDQSYSVWKKPTTTKSTAKSRTGSTIVPEIIEFQHSYLKNACSGSDYCVIVFMVHSYSAYTSRFRIKYFQGENKMYENVPVHDSVMPKEYKYYWFVSTYGLRTSSNPDWYHYLAAGLKTLGADVDMYVSVFDGRLPTTSDYDFASTQVGADVLKLEASDPWFQKTNAAAQHAEEGLVIVVGIYNPGEVTAQFNIIEKSFNYFSSVRDILTNESQSVTVNKNSNRGLTNADRRVFKWYNWEHGNFQLQVRALEGKANFYLNLVGETNYEQNVISGIPTARNDSIWFAELDAAQADQRIASVDIYRSDLARQPQFCFDCWYYITAEVSTHASAQYRVFFQRLQDQGTDYQELELGKSSSFSLPLALSQRYAKFMLDSKDSFNIKVTVSSGQALIHISNDPAKLDSNQAFWSLDQDVGTGYIRVNTDDPNFHMGTMYYVSVRNNDLELSPTFANIQIEQIRTVYKIANGVPNKFQFTSDRELVKFAVFEIPKTWSSQTVTKINIQALTDNFYPSIYLFRIQSEDEAEDVETMAYPTIIDYDEKYGTNPIAMLGITEFEYQLDTVNQANHNYITMAIYQNVYGMTDRRKPEFKLTISSEQVGASVSLQQPHLSSPAAKLGTAAQPVVSEQEGKPQQASWYEDSNESASEFLQL